MKDRKRNPDSRKNIVFNIQSIILSVLMAISLVTIIVMGLLLYHRFKLALEKTAVDLQCPFFMVNDAGGYFVQVEVGH